MNPTTPQRQPPDLSRPLKPRRVLARLIPFAMMLFAAGLVAYQELPQFSDAVLGYTQPDALRALTVCREAALRQSTSPAFARLVDHGEAHRTQDGHYVDDVVVGEMQSGQGEVRVGITCHVSASGELAQIHRKTLSPPGPPN